MEHQAINKPVTNRQVIEFNGEPVGVVVPDADLLKFVAVKYHVWELDARRFRSAADARDAVVAHLNGASKSRTIEDRAA